MAEVNLLLHNYLVSARDLRDQWAAGWASVQRIRPACVAICRSAHCVTEENGNKRFKMSAGRPWRRGRAAKVHNENESKDKYEPKWSLFRAGAIVRGRFLQTT